MPQTLTYVKPTGFVENAGAIYVGSGTPVGMGATEGGITWDPGLEIGHPEWDGKTAEIVGMHFVADYSKNAIKGDMLDLSGTALGRYEPGSSSDGSTGTNTITPVDGLVFFQQGAYLQDVTYIGLRSDGKLVEVFMPWALIKKYSVKTQAKQAAKVSIEITAVLGPTETDINKCPYVWKEIG